MESGNLWWRVAVCALVGTSPAFPLFGEDARLIDVKTLAPNIRIEMRYASSNNFTGQKLYPVEECLLCEPAAKRLANVQKNLEKLGLGLKVWDCYRPLSIQKKLWEIVPDPRYVADPKTGSRHNRGASVDLTLVDALGQELPMPTAFDEFSNKAHRDFMDLSGDVIANRMLLQTEMEKEGFIGLPTEWWHFDSPDWNLYALRDEPLGSKSLRKDITAMPTLTLPDSAQQLVVVTAKEWSSNQGVLQRYEKVRNKWKKVGASWEVSLGSKGLKMATDKKEGDLTAPAGVFKIGQAYGAAIQAPAGTKWPYQALSEGWVCVDDPKSAHYNRVFSPDKSVKKDWSSAETMLRQDHLYTWVINIEHNAERVAERGSCIFFHVWRTPNATTEGCTAMDEKNILTLLGWLDPSQNPQLVQGPESLLTPFPW